MRSRRNLCGQVVHDLGCQILAGDVKPGEPLPQEAVLCDKMGVSRTVIREAIKSLAAKGLVDSRAKRGTIVLPARSWNYLDPEVLDWQSRADTGDSQLFFLTEFRQTIEPAAAALAAERASDEQLQAIRAAFEQMEENTDKVDEFLKADLQFHTEILHATGNLFFSPVANVIHVSLASSLRVTNRQASDNRTSIPPHRKVLDAICARDADAAREAMRSLLKDANERIQKATQVS
ncbi:FadR/GntR family transcriptional regulator [Rhodopirellula sp. SWK7]|uniref:FadR/GntR family transcriptional regulator n=1 Tax=Rhodopirellula sp. SWK7 TaxID=595460 RepID=UPI0005C690D9|nr:FadR/GntR family transcriptional regulator [Rhodopirellula sp. SWK7]